MKKKYKLVLKSSALVAVSAVGVSTVAVACGNTESKKEVKASHLNKRRKRRGTHKVITEGQHIWKFNGVEYTTKESANQAKNDLIAKKFEIAKKTALVKGYQLDGKSFATKNDFITYLKKEYEIKEVYFKKDTFKEVEKYKDIKNKFVNIINGLEYKGKNYESAKALVGASGDGSGNFYVQKKYEPKKFDLLSAIKAGNFIFKGKPTTRPKIKEITDLNKFKDELMRVVTEISKESKEWKSSDKDIDSTRLVLTIPELKFSSTTIPLYKGRDGRYWLFSDATISNKKQLKSSESKNLLSIIKDDVKTMDDALVIWKLISKNKFRTTKDDGWFTTSAINHETSLLELAKSIDALSNYKKDSKKWNFTKHYEVNKKTFITKKEAETEINNFVNSKVVIPINNALLNSLQNLNDLKKLINTKGVTELVNNDGSISSIKTDTNTDIVEDINKRTNSSWVVDGKILKTKNEAISKAKELANNDKTPTKSLINLDTLTVSNNPKAKVGMNFKLADIKKMLINPQVFKNIKSKDFIKQPDGTLIEVNKTNFKKGFIVVKKSNSLNSNKVFFVKHSTEQLLFESVQYKKININKNNGALYNFEGQQLNLKEFEKKFKETFVSINSMHIDELILNSKGKNYFENDFQIPETRVVGSNGMAVIDTPKITGLSETTMYIRHNATGPWIRKQNIIGIKNGDEVKLVFRKSDSSYTRVIKVNNLKRNVIDFFKNFKNGDGSSLAIKDKEAIQSMIDGFEQMGKDLLADLKFNLMNLFEVAKKYMSTDLDKRDKKEFAEAFHRIHDLLDKRFFNEIVTNKESIANRLIKTLVSRGVDTSIISNDNKTLKPELKTILNDVLDIVKVFIDDSFNFIEHSLYWKPEWMNPAHLIDIQNPKTEEDKEFINELTKNKLIETAGDELDKKDAAFKTVRELMNGDLKVYKEMTKQKPIYHIVKDVNSRVISNTFRKYLKYAEVDSKGTLGNFRLKPGDNKLDDILKAARDRIKGKNYEEDAKKIYEPKTINKPKNGGKTNATSNDSKSPLDAIFKLLKSNTVKKLIPTIKDILNSQSLKGLLNLGEGAVASEIGLSGLSHLDSLFNSITGSLSTTSISMENNLQGLLTYIFGDEGNVMMSFSKNKNGSFILRDYKSPQITTVDKDNRDTITYRKDELEVLFKKLKPLINLGLILAGSL
ncbi:MAG: hypothetical protein HRT98_04085 [Mycoplasmatales bacterium]|nr:hypothetical protein [Mycoplasmatales bacterium]